ncbi:MAG: hypothetical protein RSC20_00015 [Clostridiales bacterium]
MKKITIIRSVIIFIVFLLMLAGSILGYDYYKLTNVDTKTLLETSINNLSHRESYRFSLSSKLQLNNYNTAKTIIAGERDKNKNLHIWGKIMDTELEMYQIDQSQYRYNSKAKQWVIWKNYPLNTEPLLLMEILPETNFSSLAMKKQTYLGKEISHGKIYHIYEIILQEDSHIASEFFGNFSYKVYIEAKSKEIVKTTIKAINKKNAINTLAIKIEFFDINDTFTLSPPN